MPGGISDAPTLCTCQPAVEVGFKFTSVVGGFELDRAEVFSPATVRPPQDNRYWVSCTLHGPSHQWPPGRAARDRSGNVGGDEFGNPVRDLVGIVFRCRAAAQRRCQTGTRQAGGNATKLSLGSFHSFRRMFHGLSFSVRTKVRECPVLSDRK